MYRLPDSLERLVNALSHLPGIGEKSAQRLAYFIMKSPKEDAAELSESVRTAKDSIKNCRVCGNFTDRDVCFICSSPKRDRTKICIVENPQDIIAIESSEEYDGLYHVLMGALSPLDGIGPEELRIDDLIERVRGGGIKEIIVATDPNVEGETTATYLKQVLEGYPVRVTRLAYGIPMGGNLEYADGLTLGKAMEGRREF